MPSAYFLNAIGSNTLLVLNNGAMPPLEPFSPDFPTAGEVISYDIIQGEQPGPNVLGSNNILQVSSAPDAINYKVSIVIDPNIAPLTQDFQFLVFADGVTGRQDDRFNGITITKIDC
jgi:hypothetical protein